MTADELKEFRKRFGWSQAELARRLGCSQRAIANWEHDVHPIPETVALAASAVAMNIPAYGNK